MTQFTSKVQELGRVAIPKDVRVMEGIEPGDLVTLGVVKVKKAEVNKA